jgi:hypothetical protein
MSYNEQEKNNPSEMTGKQKGMQGNDKAPGEENAEDTENVVWKSQKGKKVDGDPSQAGDQPLDIKRGEDN